MTNDLPLPLCAINIEAEDINIVFQNEVFLKTIKCNDCIPPD